MFLREQAPDQTHRAMMPHGLQAIVPATGAGIGFIQQPPQGRVVIERGIE